MEPKIMSVEDSLRRRIAELDAENAALLEALTPSAETKRAYWGEDSTRCLPWTDIKALMTLMRKRAKEALQEGE